MWWKRTGKTLSIPVELNFEEVMYFRLGQFMCSERNGSSLQPKVYNPQGLSLRPRVLPYPGKLSLWGNRH